MNINGSVAPGFEKVKETFASFWLDSRIGASVCAYHQGKKVVDLWAGYKDVAREDPWRADTLVNIYSTTKGLAALAVAMLYDEGLVDYNAPVAQYWPEFGAAGKSKVTVAEMLAHKAGVSAVDQTLVIEDLYDWQKMTNLLAAQSPLWPPGEASGYHAVTWGFLSGELIKRITGESLGAYFRRKIGEPLDVDCYIGLPDAEHARCATLNGPNRARKRPNSKSAFKEKKSPATRPPQDQSSTALYKQSMLNPVIAPFRDACSPQWRRAEIAASNGHASARGLAKIYAALAMQGELSGTRLLSSEAIDAATSSEVETSQDLVMGSVIRRSRGFILNTDGNYGPSAEAFGHNGTGGSTAFADRKNGVSFAYVMNQMVSDPFNEPRANRLTDALFQCIEQ